MMIIMMMIMMMMMMVVNIKYVYNAHIAVSSMMKGL